MTDEFIRFKKDIENAKNQSFIQSIISTFYFFYIITPIGRYFNPDGNKLAWILIDNPNLLDNPDIVKNSM